MITLIGGGLAASSAAHLGFFFKPEAPVIFSPLTYTQGLKFHTGESGSLNYSKILSISLQKPSTTLTIATQAVNTTRMFENLTLTLMFNSTTVTLNGLKSEVTMVTLGSGYYVVSGRLAYQVLFVANTILTGAWTITIS